MIVFVFVFVFLFSSFFSPFRECPSSDFYSRVCCFSNLAALAIILIIVALINSGFQWFQQRSSSNVMQSIRTMVPASARVKRDGAFKDVPVSEVVLGDVVEVKGGDRVPADLRLLQTSGTRMDLSALTGETEPIRSTTFNTSANYMESRNIAFLGTHALEGSAVGVVVATGDQSVMCRIAQSASAMPVEDSYLVRQVRRLVHVIATMAAFS